MTPGYLKSSSFDGDGYSELSSLFFASSKYRGFFSVPFGFGVGEDEHVCIKTIAKIIVT